jgi:hypothetical protein
LRISLFPLLHLYYQQLHQQLYCNTTTSSNFFTANSVNMPVITSLVDEFREDIATFRANGMTMAERRAHATEVGLESLGPTIKSEFEDMISADGYSCRWRPDSEKHTKMCVVLSDSTAIRTASDRNLHHWAREHFELREQGRVLYKSPDDDYKEYRRVLWPSEVFDTIARAHLQAFYTGRNKT